MVRNLNSTTGDVFKVGETIRFSWIFCTSTNSLKLKVILFSLKFREESLGVTCNNTGGNESLGPPVGGIIFAQPELRNSNLNNNKMARRYNMPLQFKV